MKIVEIVEMSESYYGNIKSQVIFDRFFQNSTAGPAVAVAVQQAVSPQNPNITKYIDDGITFNLADESSLTQILNQSPGSYMYKSSDAKVATVDNANGMVTLTKPGTTTITVDDNQGDTIATITLNVEQSKPSGLSTINVEYPTLTKKLSDGNFNLITDAGISAESKLTFTVSDKTVAGVDTDGNVTLKTVGTAHFTVTDGNETKSITLNVVADNQAAAAPGTQPPPSPPLTLEVGCIATYNGEKVHVYQDIDVDYVRILKKDGTRYKVEKNSLSPIMSKSQVDKEENSGKKIDDLLIGGKGRRRRSTRKYHKRRGRGNGNNGRRRLTRKVKGQSGGGGGGGGGGGARRGGKIHRKTKTHRDTSSR
jgi:hypothetical protein